MNNNFNFQKIVKLIKYGYVRKEGDATKVEGDILQVGVLRKNKIKYIFYFCWWRNICSYNVKYEQK
jgi:hypothetical protein